MCVTFCQSYQSGRRSVAHAALLLGLQVVRPVEVSAWVSRATSFLVIHADGDVAVFAAAGHADDVAVGVREAAIGFGALARATLELAADL